MSGSCCQRPDAYWIRGAPSAAADQNRSAQQSLVRAESVTNHVDEYNAR